MDPFLVGVLAALLLGGAAELFQRRFLRGWAGLALAVAAQSGLSLGILFALGAAQSGALGGDALAAAAGIALLAGLLLVILAVNAVIGIVRLRRRARPGDSPQG